MKRFNNYLILLSALTFLAACGSDSTGPDDNGSGQLSGTYLATTIAGNPLPYIEVHDHDYYCDDRDGEWVETSSSTSTSFTITFNKNKTYKYEAKGSTSCVYSDGHVMEISDDDSYVSEYEIDGNNLLLYNLDEDYEDVVVDGQAFAGTISGNSITIWPVIMPGIKIHFEKK